VAKSTRRVAFAAAVGAAGLLGLANAGNPQQESSRHFEGLPAQDPGSARLGIQDAHDVQVEVSIRRKTMACNSLEALVQVRQGGATHAESRACFGEQRPARTDVVVGQGAQRQFYKIAFEYSPAEQTVAYSIRRVLGADVIESQRVVVDVRPIS
jgi:hypothetical protein